MEEKNKGKKRWITFGVLGIMTMAALAAWAIGERGQEPSSLPGKYDTGFVLAGPDSYDSADTAILVGRDDQENTLTFLNLELGRRYTLTLSGSSRFYDKYGQSLSPDQVKTGELVDITFLKSDKHLTTLQLSTQAWTYEDISRYEFNNVKGEVTIGSEIFKLTSNTQYLSEGRVIESMDLNPADVLCFSGIGNQVLSVRVERGHGYLRLQNDENFVGGWIEVGQAVIQRISQDMLVLVPEGSYDVNVSYRGGGGTKRVVIGRNQETVLDIGDLEIPEPQSGMVLFALNPSTAELYIDGTLVDASGPITLEYGLHQLIARAEGYQSLTQYFSVRQASVGLNVKLDPYESIEEGSSSSATESPKPESTAEPTTNYYKVYIDAPEKVQVYLDGSYVGIAPCSFQKTAGTHVITLRRAGYTTRSYTIEVDSEKRDISYAFADLEYSGDSTVSGNIWDQILDMLN